MPLGVRSNGQLKHFAGSVDGNKSVYVMTMGPLSIYFMRYITQYKLIKVVKLTKKQFSCHPIYDLTIMHFK